MIDVLRSARFAILLIASIVVTASLAAAQPVPDDLTVEGAWVRMVPRSQATTGGFLTLVNRGSVDRALVDARSPRAKTVELHEMIHEGDRMRMRQVERIVVPAGQTVQLKPGGLHLMLFEVTTPLQAGEKVPLTLVFDDRSTIDVEAEVRMPEGHR